MVAFWSGLSSKTVAVLEVGCRRGGRDLSSGGLLRRLGHGWRARASSCATCGRSLDPSPPSAGACRGGLTSPAEIAYFPMPHYRYIHIQS